MTSEPTSELRPAYRTLSEPTMLLGIALAGWAAILTAAGVGYGWLLISPLPWRANASLVIIGLGAPVALLLLRETSAISPARLLAAAVRWRTRPRHITGTHVTDGAVRLTTPPGRAKPLEPAGELPWLDPPASAPANPADAAATADANSGEGR